MSRTEGKEKTSTKEIQMNTSSNLLVLGVTGQVGKLVAKNLRRRDGVHYVILIEGCPDVAEGPSCCRSQRPEQKFRCRWHSARPACGWPARDTTRPLSA